MVEVVALAKLGAFEKALKISKKIKSKNIYNAAYYNVVGIICRRLGLLDEALLNSQRAIQIDKSLVAAKMNIANIEIQKGVYLGGKKILDNTCISTSGNLVNKDKSFNWEIKKRL